MAYPRKPRLWSYLWLCALSLCYNDHVSWSYTFDTLMEPMFWLVDNFTKVLGPIFVVFVVLLNSVVIGIAYLVGLPYYWEKSPVAALFLVAFGQFFFVNVVFHYWMAFWTGPGEPPTASEDLSSPQSQALLIPAVSEVSSICKKCIAPKPPRTHHCSVCDRCVLKMDHHCPWLNNCVGHFNHRYFFLYMVYTVLGCLFVMVFGFEIFWTEIFNEVADDDETLYLAYFTRHSLIGTEVFLTTGTFLVLGALTLWHANLISMGETSIEAHVNKAETKRLRARGKTYRNPYDFSPWHNWCLFLGLIEGRGWKTILFPSRHLPKGNGLSWDTVYNCDILWNDRYKANNLLSDTKLA